MNTATTNSKTIVHVEDDAVTLAAYGLCLQREGFEVQPAKDGLEAIKMLFSSIPDLVVLDLMLPKVNGVEVLNFIRNDQHHKALPVITLSTNSIIDAKDDNVLAGANRRLFKETCTPSILLKNIQELLANPPIKIHADLPTRPPV
jgi:chemosensory pili system protein ChpA (sensor histidine kinase/response regulator)